MHTLWTLIVGALAVSIDELYYQPKFDVRLSPTLKEPYVNVWMHHKQLQCHVPPESQWQARVQPPEPGADTIALAAELLGMNPNCTYFYPGGYWGYKVCHNGAIRQINPHRDGDKYIFSDNFANYHLGNRTEKAATVEYRNEWLLKVPFENGEICDLTGTPRITDVFYRCNSEIETDQIRNVLETNICVYEVVVDTPKICGMFETAKDLTNYIECFDPSSEANDPKFSSRLANVDSIDDLFEMLGLPLSAGSTDAGGSTSAAIESTSEPTSESTNGSPSEFPSECTSESTSESTSTEKSSSIEESTTQTHNEL